MRPKSKVKGGLRRGGLLALLLFFAACCFVIYSYDIVSPISLSNVKNSHVTGWTLSMFVFLFVVACCLHGIYVRVLVVTIYIW